jgi:hypothetical protein
MSGPMNGFKVPQIDNVARQALPRSLDSLDQKVHVEALQQIVFKREPAESFNAPRAFPSPKACVRGRGRPALSAP